MKKIWILSLVIAICFSSVTVNASVLGSTLVNGYTIDVGYGTTSTHNTWYSDQEGVGQQTENYIVYNPNENVEPIITHGEYLYGATTINTEVSNIRNNGVVPLAGVNADFFSLDTGVPMSNIISNGKILTKTGSSQYSIGILNDNTAFMSKLTLYSMMTKQDGTKMHIHMINKYRQPYSAYLLTDDFSTETHNNTSGYDVVLGSITGEMKLGQKITATVESINENSGSIEIPKGKMILTVDSNAPEEYLNPVKSLEIGEIIDISFTFDGDERWNDVKIGLGATGEVLIKNNEIQSGFTTGANPRTAIGIKDDGSILLYTIDGRQKGYSYGVQLKTLANRLKELGCVDAINLDGGGSTSYVIQFPGDSVTTLVNKPSDGNLRRVSNFLFLKNNLSATGILNNIMIYPLNVSIVVDSSAKLTAKGYDTSFYQTPLTNLKYSVESGYESTITNDGLFTAKDDGNVTVYAKSNGKIGKINIICVSSPTTIDITKKSGTKIDKLTLNANESIDLFAKSFNGYTPLIVDDDKIIWSCDEEIGEITDTGKFTAKEHIEDKIGKIYVTVGEKTESIPVNINGIGNRYNEININTDEENIIIDFTLLKNITIDKNSIQIKVDGKLIDFEYLDNKATAKLPENTGKITVFAKNSVDCTSFATKIISNLLYNNPFVDTETHWAKDILSYMFSAKIINGEATDKGLIFNPGKSMTRSEFAVMITNYLGVDVAEYSDVVLPYDDINIIPNWALNSFKALYKLGVVKGSDTNGKLYANPTDSITRAETATIISRTLPSGLDKNEITSSDKNDIKEWFVEGFEILVKLGAINGYEDGTILPNNNVTKAEAAKILYKIL